MSSSFLSGRKPFELQKDDTEGYLTSPLPKKHQKNLHIKNTVVTLQTEIINNTQYILYE